MPAGDVRYFSRDTSNQHRPPPLLSIVAANQRWSRRYVLFRMLDGFVITPRFTDNRMFRVLTGHS